MRPVLVLSLILALAPVASASPKHWHEGGKKHHNGHDEAGYGRDCYFRTGDVRIIREYYEPRYPNLPPGMAKKLYRTGHLPPGWAKKMQPVPVVVDVVPILGK